MAVHKLIQISSLGVRSEYAGKNASAGAGDAGEFVILDASGKIDASMLPTAVGADSISATTGAVLSAGDFVYIDASGLVQKADGTNPAKAAMGYVNTGYAASVSATVFFDDSNTGLASLTIGATYYLSATPGAATTTPPTTAGQIVQRLGVATSATSLHTSIQAAITRA